MSTNSKVATVVPFKAKNAMNASERAKLARLPAPVHQVQEKGKQYFLKALRSLFDNADDALFSLADKANNNNEQNLYFESMREVRIRRRQVESDFVDAIDDAFAALVTETPQVTQEEAAISADNLSLVQDDELEELVAVDSMVARANEQSGERLQLLSLRVDSLVPIKVYHKNNPVGPDVVCNIFANGIRALDADIKAKLVLFKLFDKYVVSQMPKIYEALNNVLIEANVLPSLTPQHAKRQAPQAPAGSQQSHGYTNNGGQEQHSQPNYAQPSGQGYAPAPGHGGAGTTQHNPGYQAAPQGAAQGGYGAQSSGQQGGAPASGADAVLLSALTQVQTQQSEQWRQHPAGTVAAVQNEINNVLSQLLQSSRQVGDKQNDVINLVKLLFEFILDDRNLAEPMKVLIGRLQIPILKVAIMDSSFFNKSGHPARRLLNEMATASLGWQVDPSLEKGQQPSDPLYRKVAEVVDKLLNEFEADVSVFNELLADFVSFVEKDRRRAAILEQRTVDAEDGKARAESAREQVTNALTELVGDQQLPDEVQHILSEAWSNVLFLISLKEGVDSKGWKQAIQTAEDLVWSVSVPVDAASRKALMTMIPNLVKQVRQGLEKISFNPFELTKLLSQLEKLHMQRLRAPLQVASSEAQNLTEPKADTIFKTPADAVEKPAAPKANLQAVERPAVNKPAMADVKPSLTPEPSQSATAPAAKASSAETAAPLTKAATPAAKNASPTAKSASPLNEVVNDHVVDDSYLALVSKLTQGTWFEMADEGGRKYRCRLAAIIKATGKYIFVNRSGMKVAEKTRESLALSLKQGDLALLDDTMLFDRALESVIGNLRKSRPASTSPSASSSASSSSNSSSGNGSPNGNKP